VSEPWELSEVRELLRAVYATNSALDLYELHQKYLLSPAQVLRAVRLLAELGIVSVGDNSQSVALTDRGRNWVLANRRRIFSKHAYWKTVPNEDGLARQRSISRITKGLRLRESDLRFLGLAKRKS
jgi:predicted methyltransferase